MRIPTGNGLRVSRLHPNPLPIHVLERGGIVESGTHDSLLETSGVYYAMRRQQIGERGSGQVRWVDENALIEPEAESAAT